MCCSNNNILFITLACTISIMLTGCGGGGSDTNYQPQVIEEKTDTVAPVLSISIPTANPAYTTNEGTVTIGGTVSDDTAVTEFTWVNASGGTGSIVVTPDWEYPNIPLTRGTNVITVTAKDADNNTSTASINIEYAVQDTQSPTVNITSPNDNNQYTTDLNRVSIAGTSSDNYEVTRVTWSTNTGRNGTATGTDPWIVNDIPLNQGSNVITVTAYDSANNQSQDTLNVNYEIIVVSETCMSCHNGATTNNDYTGAGLTNPHPFAGAQNIRCTVCHGGNGNGEGKLGSHVPPPPEIGDDQNLVNDPVAYFNRLSLTGIDKYPDYTVDGVNYSAIDYLQFINPGDLRVVTDGRSCGRCHGSRHVEWVSRSPLATETGILSGAMYAAGLQNQIREHRGLYQDTAADLAFRAISNPDYIQNQANIGAVGRLIEFPVSSQYNVQGGFQIFNNAFYDANNLANDLYNAAEQNGAYTNRVRPNSALATLYHEQIAFTCGDCHLGSAGANNRFGDFRSSGCTACHMAYSPDGRSRSTDPNVDRFEPANPDQIVAPERPHITMHRIQNVAKTLPNGEFVTGIQDQACAGCHQGSNRTVMQFWGIRLDQNQDLTNNQQYPANPANFQNTANDPRLFDPGVNNNTFNGRNANQYIAYEDYDNDNRDDTPADIHHEAGLGCIDCHGSRDLHGGAPNDESGGQIRSRQEQVVAIQCENCHGSVEQYAYTQPCLTYADTEAECAVDTKGNPLRHVTREASTGNYFLISRLDGQRHYLPQTRDTVIQNNKINPLTRQLVYSEKASYAMGRADADVATGIGPMQANPLLYTNGFSHSDNMDCASCHASWTNSCIGCHLAGEYDADPNNFRFSNITGERIIYNEANADFVYQTPIPFILGVNADNRITQMSAAEKVFYRYTDLNGNTSQVFAFSDRNGNGNNPDIAGRNAFPALGHNVMMAHSIRGKIANNNEGPRYCVACHLTRNGINQFGDEYNAFRTAMANNDFANLDFNLLQQHFGQNTGNQLDSPLWVHMVVGLGSGLYLFDQNGCPVNELDNNNNREYCNGNAPADNFNANNVVYNLDRIVEATGISNASNNHPIKNPGAGNVKRGGALNQNLSGPLGAQLIEKLADPNVGVVLDSWLDADAQPRGDAANFLNNQ
jgi:hypothetical protein